ncbi:hypothetical protein DXG01_011638 [Tephrocybe rancida]|nr:hypothetical protein DXG01_011638 [Tephrocybe rancida]
MHLVRNRHSAASPLTIIRTSGSTTTNTVDIVMKLAKDVTEMLKDIPYVKAVAGIIIQIIQIRDEIKMTKERSLELINKVLYKSEFVLDGLLFVAKSSHKDGIIYIEGQLTGYHKLLVEVLSMLQANTSSSRLSDLSRLEDFEKYNHRIDNFNTDFVTDLVLQLNIGKTPQQSSHSSSTASLWLYKPVLPPPPQLMIGRDEEKSKVIDTLLHTLPAHIAILGGGGVGKTTLALSVLHEQVVADKFPSQYFVSCEGVPSVVSLMGEIANALCIPLAHRDAHLIDTIIVTLPAHSLLCMDNLETIWDDETMQQDLEGLLSILQLHVGIIITICGTQRPLGVSWSKPLLPPLQSLSYNNSRHIFELTTGLLDEFVEKLLNAVDGIPLAISLISALLQEGGESSKSLWGQWAKAQSGALENGGSDRLSNLDTSIHLSVHGPQMQANPKTIDILAMLSVLPDGFPDDDKAMEELESHLPEGYNPQKAFLIMQQVSLVHINEEGTYHRLQMIYPVRVFCQQRLELPSRIRDGITSYYVEKIGHFTDVSNPFGHAIIQSELRNIYAVLVQAWKEGRGSPPVTNASILFTQWSTYVGNPVEEVISLTIQGGVDPPGLHGTCHSTLGEVYLLQDKLDEAEASFEHAAKLHQQAHSVLGKANDIQKLGEVYMRQEKLDQAKASFVHAAELHQQAHSVLGEANNTQKLAEVYMRQNKLDQAEASFEHAKVLHQQVYSVFGEANDVSGLGEVYVRQYKLDEAEASFKHAAKLHQQAHSVLGEANNIQKLGEVYVRQYKLDEAEASFKHAAKLHQQAHSVLGEANNVQKLGEVYVRQYKLDEAEASFEHAAQLHQQAHSVLGEANNVQKLGEVYMLQDKLDKAEASFEHAKVLHQQVYSVFGEANDVSGLGEVYVRQYKLDEAEASFEHAAQLHQQAHSVLGEANNVQKLGEVYMLQDKLDKAEASFEHAKVLHQQVYSVLGEANDVKNIGDIHMRQDKLDETEALLAVVEHIETLEQVYLQQDEQNEAETATLTPATTSVSGQHYSNLNTFVDSVQISAKHVTPDHAQLHITNCQDALHQALIDWGYTGSYSLHSAFDEDTFGHLEPEEDIYIVLDSEVSDEMHDALGEIFSPILGIVMTPNDIGAYEHQVEEAGKGARPSGLETTLTKSLQGDQSVGGKEQGEDSDWKGKGKNIDEGGLDTRGMGASGGGGHGGEDGSAGDNGGGSGEGGDSGGGDRGGGDGDDNDGEEEQRDNVEENENSATSSSSADFGSINFPFSSVLVSKDRQEKFEIYAHIKAMVGT